ncbi:TetR/AcrR family transcriptional regulator [Nocardia sp. 2YAB30]|uniref:TetR/AcrR family transcriptional regulator n=1 Tax=unclassified Nocardia TaxID=2637762 RepID=UPI003F9AA053
MTESATSAHQLPRGRHGLPRELVIASQRERILIATAQAMAENGYVGTSVAAILKRAGVSRETFYEQFRSKEHCFDAAYERAVQMLLDRIADANGGEEDSAASKEWDAMARMDRIFRAYLQHLIDDPASARLFLVEVFAVGSAAISRRAQLQELFVGLIAGVLDARTEQQRFACQALAAAIGAMVTARIAAGDPDGLLALREPLLDLVRGGGELYGCAVVDHALRRSPSDRQRE